MPRKLCEQCQRPLAVCLCPYLVKLQAPCRLLILQHPSEQKQALATVPILSLCLEPLEVWVGEDFTAHPELSGLLEDADACRVLFPSDQSKPWDMASKTLAQSNDGQVKTVIIIDGTWRKAKLIWHLNPWLQRLPCVRLEQMDKSQYQIRSSTVEGGVSTLEAVANACEYLTSDDTYQDLLKPFKAMINMQIEKMGKEVFLAHYGKSQD